jgi:hypothetical protein
MIKELPKSSWVDFLMDFAKDHEGEVVDLYVDNGEGEKLIAENQLISFEGDCDGEIVNGVKVVIGEEGDNPDNLFHFVKSPQKIEFDEDDDGVVESITIEDSDGVRSILDIL